MQDCWRIESLMVEVKSALGGRRILSAVRDHVRASRMRLDEGDTDLRCVGPLTSSEYSIVYSLSVSILVCGDWTIRVVHAETHARYTRNSNQNIVESLGEKCCRPRKHSRRQSVFSPSMSVRRDTR